MSEYLNKKLAEAVANIIIPENVVFPYTIRISDCTVRIWLDHNKERKWEVLSIKRKE